MSVPRSWVSKLERGLISSPGLSSVFRLAAGLSVPVECLIEEDEIVAFAWLAAPRMGSGDRDAILGWCERRVA